MQTRTSEASGIAQRSRRGRFLLRVAVGLITWRAFCLVASAVRTAHRLAPLLIIAAIVTLGATSKLKR